MPRFYVRDWCALYDLARIDHGIMYGIAVIVGVILARGELSFAAALGFFVALFIEMGIFAMNDFFDWKVDRYNKRYDRPLVRGDVSREFAIAFSICSLLLGNVLAVFISYFALAIALTFSTLSVVYNIWAKKYAMVGNVFIATTMTIPLFYGGVIAGSITDEILALAAIVFVAGIGREIMKDVQDIKGDKKFKMKTLPIIVGTKKAIYSAIICFGIAIVTAFIPFFTFFKEKIAYFLILVPIGLYAYTSYKILNPTPANLRCGRKLTLIGAAIALVAFLLSALQN